MQETIKTRSGRVIIMPTAEEEAQINAGIAADADFARALPHASSFRPRCMRNFAPCANVAPKTSHSGKGWQTRVNEAMREWVRKHPAI